MDQAKVRKTSFKLSSLFHGEPMKEHKLEPEPTIVPFPDYMVRKLAAALPGTGVIGLQGPTGSGKRMLLKQASTLPVREHDLLKFLERDGLRQLIKDLQQTLEGQCVWVLQASRLSEGLVRCMTQRTWTTRIVLVSDTKNMGP